MAAILQLRQGSTSTYISQGANIAEPFFDTGSNILVVGKSASEVIKLTKLNESNDGSFSITGDYTGSHLYLSGDLYASNANLSGDITIGGNIILGDQVQDTITVSGQFDSDLIPSASEEYNIGSITRKWNHLYALSASIDSIDLVSNLPSGVLSGSEQINTGSIHFVSGVQGIDLSTNTSVVTSIVLQNGLQGSETSPTPSFGVKILSLSAGGLDFDGPGNLLIDTGSNHFIEGTQQASLAGLPQGTVSSSQQVVDFLPTNTVSGSSQVIDFLPSGTVSGSVQVLGDTNIVSSSQQVIDFLPNGTISGSTQITNGSTILSSSIQTNGFDSYTTDVNNRLTPLETSTNALNAVSHSHANKANLDTINQNLSTTSQVQFLSLQSGQTEISSNLVVAGTGSFANNVTIYGNLSVFGTESILNSENLAIADNMIYLNSGSTITNPDLGWAGNYNDGTYAHAGIFRDASDGVFKFYDSYTPEPEGNIDTSHITFNFADIQFGAGQAALVTAENFIGTGSQLVFPGTDIVSSSQQVIDFLPSGTVSGSTQITDGSGIVSSSNQIDTGSTHFQEGVALYSINGVTPLSGLYGSANGLGVQIRGLSADGLSFDGPGNLIIDTGSDYFVSGAQEASLLGLPQGTVSGSDQVLGGTNIVSSSQQVIDFLPNGTISGSTQITDSSGLLSSSNENFSDYSQSVDLRLLDTLSSGSDISSSLYDLVGNFPTSGSLGTAAFYNVSSSLGDDPDVIPNVKAVFDYINNTIGAADITGVSASLGLSGGGNGGYVSLSLDTASAHFQAGVELYGTSQVEVVNILNDNNVISSSIQLNGENLNLGDITGSYIRGGTGHFTGVLEVGPYVLGGPPYIPSFYVNNDGDTSIRGTLQLGPVGHINDVSASISSIDVLNTTQNNRLDSIEFLSSSLDSNVSTSEIIIKNSDGTFTGSNSYADFYNLAIATSTPTSIVGTEQLTINGTTTGLTGILAFTENDTLHSFDYVQANVRYIDTNAGVSIAIKPDADETKAWIFDTSGDLVSNEGLWGSGGIYAWTGNFSGSVSASDAYIVNRVNASDVGLENGLTNFTGSFYGNGSQLKFGATNIVSSSIQISNYNTFLEINGDGVVSGSSQIDVEQTTNYNQVVNISGTQTIGGTKTFNDIVVNGTGSFAYFISTESQLNTIGQSFIVLNNDTPTQRYAGLAVYDSGSAGVTASLQFDGQTNDWFYEYSDDGGVTTDHGAVLFGPEYSTKGAPTYPTNNTIQKGNGGHHLLDSNITDNGSLITLGSNTSVTGVLSATTFAGMISGSSQITYSEITGIPTIAFTAAGDAGVNQTITNGNTLTIAGGTGVSTSGGATDTITVSIGQSVGTSDDVTFQSIDVIGGSIDIRHTSPTLLIRNTDTTIIENQVLGELKFLHSDSDGGFAEVGIIKSVATEIFSGVTSDSYKIHIDSNTIVNGTLESTGDVVAYSSSDRRLKDNILPISNPLQKINSIGGYSFDWNVEKQHIYKGKDYGVIAQEIEEILPELVDTRENGYKAVKYDKLVSLLIEGIKELSQEVKELKEKINKE